MLPVEETGRCDGTPLRRPGCWDSGASPAWKLSCLLLTSERWSWRKRSCIVFSAAACLQQRLSAGRLRLIHFAFVCKSLILFVSFPFSCCVMLRVNPRSACVRGKAANVFVASSWLSLRARCHTRSLQINTLGMWSDREDAPLPKTLPVALLLLCCSLDAKRLFSGLS